jgi:integrase
VVAETLGAQRSEDLPKDTPLWLPLQHGYIQEVRPIAHDAVRAVYLKRLDTGKVHTSRHTFVKAMLADKATVLEVQRQLGHANSSTTDHYIGQLTSDENEDSDAQDRFFGVESPTG